MDVITASLSLTLVSATMLGQVERVDEELQAPPKPVPVAARDVAETGEEPPQFVRLTRDRWGEPSRLQTAVARYVPESDEGDLTVDLIGAVHIGDRSYYKDLDELFQVYDVLLFELVMPEGSPVPDGTPVVPEDPLSMLMQIGLDVLDLESQKDHIDYTAPNFVHADMSPAEMAEAMRARGDDALTVGLSMFADMLRQQNLAEWNEEEVPQPPEIDPFALLVDPEAGMELKRFLAEQITAQELSGGLGPTINQLLIDDRNEKCMRVFQKQLVAGKTKIGIFYGAAHLADFDERLRRDFGMKRQRISWLTAWDLR